MQALHEGPSTGALKLGILSFNAQKKAVNGRARELRQIKDRVM
jgi:hypothetical protein